jgi:hypothetical protein
MSIKNFAIYSKVIHNQKAGVKSSEMKSYGMTA